MEVRPLSRSTCAPQPVLLGLGSFYGSCLGGTPVPLDR